MKFRVKRIAFYLGVVLLAVAAFVVGRDLVLPSGGPVAVTSNIPATGAVIGGPFTLVDHTGKTVTEEDYGGRFMLIYFGFTYCPDACPTTLTTMGEALDIIGPAADKIVPLLISVDPERDTPEQLAMYVRHFHPSLLGLTGTADQVAQAAKAYRVYYAKVKEKGSDEDDYTMDHTSIVYLMGPDGTFRAHFAGHATSPEAMAKRILDFL